MSEKLSSENRHDIIDFLRLNLCPAKKMHKKCTAYSLKQALQSNKGFYVDWYVTEEEFIDLMTKAGFKSDIDSYGITRFYITQKSADRMFKMKNRELKPNYVSGTLEAIEIIKENTISKRLSWNKSKREIYLDENPMNDRDENAIIQHFRNNGISRFWVIPYALNIIAKENTFITRKTS